MLYVGVSGWEHGTMGRIPILLAAASVGCAGGRSPTAVQRGGPIVEAVQAAPLDATDAALLASGYVKGAELSGARARLEAFVVPLVNELGAVRDERTRARRLLAFLHGKGGLLGRYDARATTLRDVLERRRFNCVSASVLYNLLADRLRLDAAAQLLPTHARTLLSVVREGRLERVVVESTSPAGFDPSAEAQQRILAGVAGVRSANARTLVSDSGAVVSTNVLIGIIYVNRASIAQESGDLERAESLFRRGEAFANDDAMGRILREQRAALLSQLAGDDVVSADPERVRRAYQTLKAAVGLVPEVSEIRAAVLQNLRAAAERVIFEQAQSGEEEPVLQTAAEAASLGLAPEDRSGLRAFALSEIGRLRIERHDYDGALDALELALAEQLAPADAPLRGTLEANRVSALRLAAFTHARRGEYAESLALMERVERLGAREALEKDRLRVIHLVGNKRLDDRDYRGAAAVYRDGVRRYPFDETSRHNLVAVLERLATPLVDTARCDDVRPYLEEIRMLEPDTPFPGQAEGRCLMERARRRLDARDYAEAVELMRAARRVSPDLAAVQRNLRVALVRWAHALAAEGQCRRARRLLEEASGLELSVDTRAAADLGGCG